MVSAADSTEIVADLRRGNPDSTVLIVPGFWRSRSHPLMGRIAARLHQAGLTVCMLDNRGHGESGGTYGFNTREAGDCISVLERLKSEGLLTVGACIIGFSAGGAIALSTAATRPDLVRGLVLVSPVAEFKRVVPRPNPFRLNRVLSAHSLMRPPRFWWYERSRRDVLDDARHVSAPVCIIHAMNDWLVHHRHSERIAEALPRRPELHLLDLERAHAERVFESSLDAWNIATAFMTESLGMSMSGA